MTYVAPEFNKKWFHCPNCNIHSNQDWDKMYADRNWAIYMCTCQHCNDFSIWFSNEIVLNSYGWNYAKKGKMVHPKKSSVPIPNEDLTENIKIDYIEASNILNDSPRWACALLRLALQKLMIQLWEKWENINNDIWNLVKKWLPKTVQQALDSVRVVWNESVHPWELDLKDDTEIATKIFTYINIIADILITQPKLIDETYNWLPDSKLEWIENRDNQ